MENKLLGLQHIFLVPFDDSVTVQHLAGEVVVSVASS